MKIAQHDQPPDADFLVHIDLTSHGMAGRREQIWVKQVGDLRFAVRSLPFFAYGIRPGDEVSTDESYVVQSVVASSGKQLLRIAVGRETADEMHEALHPLLVRCAVTHEWLGAGYVAIELGSEDIPPDLAAWLSEARLDGHQIHVEFA